VKILFDVITPKQARMAVATWKRFSKDHEIRIASREYAETNDVLNHYKVPFISSGKYFSETREKFMSRIERLHFLVNNFSDVDAIITQAAIETVHMGVGLGKPVVVLTDVPKRKYLNRQIIPSATYHLREELTNNKWEYEPEVSVYMHACQEHFYTKPVKRKNPNLVVFREFERHASYAEGITPIDIHQQIQSFCSDHGYELLELARYKSHRFVPPEEIFTKAAFVVTGGSSMAIEAALTQIPAVSFFQGYFPKFEYLIEREYPIKRIHDPKSLQPQLEQLLQLPPTSHQFRDDPIDKIAWILADIERQL
jgi:predicted glycosyltransferase